MRYLLLLLLLAASPLHAQLQPIGWKDPQLATILGVVLTGGGQFYTDHSAKGAALLVGSAAAVAVALHASQGTCSAGGSCGSASVETGGIVAAVALWAYGWATASHDAELHNDGLRNGAFLDHRNGRTLVGIRLAMR